MIEPANGTAQNLQVFLDGKIDAPAATVISPYLEKADITQGIIENLWE